MMKFQPVKNRLAKPGNYAGRYGFMDNMLIIGEYM